MRLAVLLLLSMVVASPLWAQQTTTFQDTIEFPFIEGRMPDEGTEGTFLTPAWQRIDEVRFDFASTDPLFGDQPGPNGGQVGVELGVVLEDGNGDRYGLASVSPGQPWAVYYPGQIDPLQGFELLSGLLADGRLTMSLGGFEGLPQSSLPLELEQPSTLTLTVTGALAGIDVPLDVRPGSCPNPLNRRSRGVVPVAVLGTAELDVTSIDPASVRLEGVSPSRSSTADVGQPYYPLRGKTDPEDCLEAGPDGFDDLVLKFDTQALIGAIDDPADGWLVLTLTGCLDDGTPITGEDVVVLVGPSLGRHPGPPSPARRRPAARR
jgi:hypothetical protein